MKKSELQALGLDDATIRAVQELHGRDSAKLLKKVQSSDSAATREAITAMLPMLKNIDSLRRVLREVNYLYYIENKPPEESGKEDAALDATNIQDGKEG